MLNIILKVVKKDNFNQNLSLEKNIYSININYSFLYIMLIFNVFKSHGSVWNFSLKSNLNKMVLYGGKGQHYLVLNKINELDNIFHVKGLIRFTFYVKLIDDTRKT